MMSAPSGFIEFSVMGPVALETFSACYSSFERKDSVLLVGTGNKHGPHQSYGNTYLSFEYFFNKTKSKAQKLQRSFIKYNSSNNYRK